MEVKSLDGKFYREIAQVQREKLIKLIKISDKYLQIDNLIPDDPKGLLRSAAGKARLLINERFQQFDGLCESNLNPKKGQMEIRDEDLGGFWDLIMIEVRSLHSAFRQLAVMAKNEWKYPVEEFVAKKEQRTIAVPAKRISLTKSTGIRRPLRLSKTKLNNDM